MTSVLNPLQYSRGLVYDAVVQKGSSFDRGRFSRVCAGWGVDAAGRADINGFRHGDGDPVCVQPVRGVSQDTLRRVLWHGPARHQSCRAMALKKAIAARGEPLCVIAAMPNVGSGEAAAALSTVRCATLRHRERMRAASRRDQAAGARWQALRWDRRSGLGRRALPSRTGGTARSDRGRSVISPSYP